MRIQDYPHRHFPLQDLIKSLGITRKGYHGLFDIIVNYIPLAYDFAFENGPVEHFNLSHGLTAPWMVTIEDPGPPHDLDITIDTDPGLISTDMATRLASSIETLLLHGMDDLGCPLASLPIMPEATRRTASWLCCWRDRRVARRRNARHPLRRSGRTDTRCHCPDMRRTATEFCRIA